MDKCPRRTLLGGIGSTLAVSVAGCLSTPGDGSPTGNESENETEAETNDDADENDADTEFDSLLEYLPAPDGDEPATLVTVDVDALAEANDPYGAQSFGSGFDIDSDSVSNAVVVELGENYSTSIAVLEGASIAGDGDSDGESDRRESVSGIEYDRYEADSRVAGVTDDVTVIARSRNRNGDEDEDEQSSTDPDALLEAAFEAAAGETERLLESDPVYEAALETFSDTDHTVVMTGQAITTSDDDDIQPEDIEYVVHGTTVRGPDTIEIRYGLRFIDASLITDEFLADLEEEFGYGAVEDDPEIGVDDTLVTVSTVLDLEAQRKAQEIESPQVRGPREIDRDAEYVELEVTRGDPTPVEDLTLELNDEEYDPDIWAGDQETIEEGDTIRIAMDDLEPNLQLTLSHEHAYGGSSMGTSINSHFEFESEYDLETETVSLEYTDEIPLDGDKLYLAVHEDRTGFDDEPVESTQPWTGQEVTEGATATLDDVPAGHSVIVGWRGDSRRDSIYTHYAHPPGYASTDYDYESKTLAVTLELDEPRPAAEYKLLVADEPAAVQWTDDGDTVEPGATIELEDVDVGTSGTVVWGDDEVRISGFTARPSVDIELRTDDGYTIEHVGGDELPIESLEAAVWTDDDLEVVELEGGDDVGETFTEGDIVSLDLEDEDVRNVNLKYDDHPVGHAMADRDES
ncbi:hypothetical protein [Halomontanus rarus]|uniref:hypothetical protein n=1 Tax=Halomontanus rarus TaxID=3034020 RepID=UPI001A997D42